MFINPYLDGFIALPYRKHFCMFDFVPIDPNTITLSHVAAANFHLAPWDTMIPIVLRLWFEHNGGKCCREEAKGRKKNCEKVHNSLESERRPLTGARVWRKGQ